MNDQAPKKILFNKSLLLSLKAEVLKKQEEVQDKKHLPQHKIENYKPSRKVSEKQDAHKKDKGEKKDYIKNLQAVDTDELEACRKSKIALEKKAELYEHLANKAGDSQLSEHFLVNFKDKKQQEPPQNEPETKTIEDNFKDEDSDWVEFTDCLGRTRKCLKSDLDHYKKRDEQLTKVITSSSDTTEKESEPQPSEKPLLVQKTNDYLQSLREKWEQKEQELLAKEKDIHYQDLLFDEARIHGVGYYSFSTDETERKKQMEELLRQRKETLVAQEQAEEVRRKREQLVAARVAAARARQRARAGLPPEDPLEVKKDYTQCLLEFLTKQKNEADAKAKEEEKKEKEEQEKERQKLRDAYVREWDIGKDGVEGKVKKFREMTQEEYVEQQRSKRIDEFGPFQDNVVSKSNFIFDTQGNKVNTDSGSKPQKSWSDVRQMEVPAPREEDFDDQTKGLYFSSKKPSTTVNYKNFVKAQESVPIQNELDDIEPEQDTQKRKLNDSQVEVAPPLTYDYYGPVPKHRKPQKPFDSDLREAFAQGSKSLEPKGSKLHMSKQYDFTFD